MTINILKINASLTPDQSASLQLSNHYLSKIDKTHEIAIIEKDLSTPLKAIDANWIGASFTPEEQRNDSQHVTLGTSDQLINELKSADEIVIASPMYNFTIPANLKTYFDLISRVGVTFKYSETGPVGLINDKPVIVIITTGGSEIGSDIDFMTPYIKQMLNFIGLFNITFVASDKRATDADNSFNNASSQLTLLAQAKSQ